MKSSLHTLALAAALTALAGCATPPSQPTGSTAAEINLVAINDLHGNLEATKFTYTGTGDTKLRTVMAGGIDTIAGALQQWRKEDGELVVDVTGRRIAGMES